MRTPTLAFLALLGASACTTGSGTLGQETREVAGFDAIDLEGPFRATIEVGSPGGAEGPSATTLELRGDDDVVPKVRAEVQGSTLHLSLPGRVVTKLPLEAIVRVPSLVELDASGAATVVVSGLEGERLEVDASGASRVSLAGRVDALDLEVSGASAVEAQGLSVTQASVDASGASTVDVLARQVLHAEASGASTIRYHGRPAQLAEDASGASTIEPAP